jgi:hypothetical protein
MLPEIIPSTSQLDEADEAAIARALGKVRNTRTGEQVRSGRPTVGRQN